MQSTSSLAKLLVASQSTSSLLSLSSNAMIERLNSSVTDLDRVKKASAGTSSNMFIHVCMLKFVLNVCFLLFSISSANRCV
jgi:hypothetical protein